MNIFTGFATNAPKSPNVCDAQPELQDIPRAQSNIGLPFALSSFDTASNWLREPSLFFVHPRTSLAVRAVVHEEQAEPFCGSYVLLVLW